MDINIGNFSAKQFKFDINKLTKHLVVLGSTGSGKTVLCKAIIEEAILNNIPVIAFDPKGDISSLGVHSKNLNFRPFSDIEAKIEKVEPNAFAKELQKKYSAALKKFNVSKEKIKKYCEKAQVSVYTPKSKAGKQIAIAPSLTPPEHFKKLVEDDENISANLIEPIAESLLSLVGYPLSVKKEITLVTKIIEHEWIKNNDLDIARLIKLVNDPPFKQIGALNVDMFINKKQRNNLVARLNLLLTTPSLKYWFNGETINFDTILKKRKKSLVSIFDLRFIPEEAEKQFFVERFLQEFYKWLIKQPGSQSLKFILYFDEIKPFVPSFPNNPPSKKILDLLIRQGRAFGLGCIFATQNPGDIDYKTLSNINIRIIGKLRSEQDIDKIITGMGLDQKTIKIKLNELKQHEFLYNDQELNQTLKLKPRWLISYHRGPLSETEIKLINKTITQSKKLKEEKLKEENIIKSSILTIPLKFSPEEIINSIIKDKNIHVEIKEIKTQYIPVLHTIAKISENEIETSLALDSDLSKRFNKFVKSNLKEDMIVSKQIPANEKVEPYLDRELVESQAIINLKRIMRATFYCSKEINFYSENKNTVIRKNKEILKPELEDKLKKINNKFNPKITSEKEKLRSLIAKLNREVFSKGKANENLKDKIKEIKTKIKELKKEQIKSIKNAEKEYLKKIKNIEKIDINQGDIKTLAKLIWLPEPELKLVLKTKSEFHLTIRQNYKGIITLGFCNKCKKNIKSLDDFFICSYCGKTFCKKHIFTDIINKKHYCDQHFVKCDICHEKFGKDLLKECPVCGRKVCPDDLVQCPNCGNIVCKKCVVKKFLSKKVIGCKLCKK